MGCLPSSPSTNRQTSYLPEGSWKHAVSNGGPGIWVDLKEARYGPSKSDQALLLHKQRKCSCFQGYRVCEVLSTLFPQQERVIVARGYHGGQDRGGHGGGGHDRGGHCGGGHDGGGHGGGHDGGGHSGGHDGGGHDGGGHGGCGDGGGHGGGDGGG